MPTPRIEIYEGKGTQPWYWRALSGNNEVVAQSEGYTRRSSARRSAKKVFPDSPIENKKAG